MKPMIRFGFFFALCAFTITATAAPACKGPNKNDPACIAPDPLAAASVNSVTVDWLNQKFSVRGSGFVPATEFLLGDGAVPLATANVTDAALDIPFSAEVAAVVDTAGNYNLFVDGAMQLTVYIPSQVIDPAATGCSCEADWMADLGALYTDKVTECIEIQGPASNDAADISGNILSNAGDPAAYPQYPIGASFYPNDPNGSVCRLVQVNGDASTVDIVNLRINEIQQADCAAALKTNVCASVIPLP